MVRHKLKYGNHCLNNMREELDRKYKVINMMITMHSLLGFRNKTKALIGNIFFLITAIILNIFVFFDYKYLEFLKFNEINIRYIINISTLLIFLISVVFMKIDWSKKGEKHELAVNQLSRLLNELRSILNIKDEVIFASKSELFNELYNQTFETIPKINNRYFNKLKAKHNKKIELSKFIDLHKGKSYFVIYTLFLKKTYFKKNE